MHTTRAVVPTQTNVIEAGHDMLLDNEKQWYYGLGNGDKSNGPITFQEVKTLLFYILKSEYNILFTLAYFIR